MVIGREKMDYKLYILSAVISLFAIMACNVCDNSGVIEERIPKNIYFTSQLLNSNAISVYGADYKNFSMDLIQNEAVLLSAPSRDGNLAVLIKSNNRSAIEMINLKSGISTNLLSEQEANYYTDYGLSGNANALYTINKSNECMLLDVNTKLNTRIDRTLNPALKPSFSPDGKYFSYLEAGSSPSDNILHIVDATNPKVEYYSVIVPYSISIYNSNGKSEMSWSKDAKSILIAVEAKYSVDSTVSSILQINLVDITTVIIDLNGVYAYEPKYSPDSKYFIFADIDGNIRKAVKTADNLYSISYLIKGNIEEKCYYTGFNSDASALIYSKRNKYEKMQFAGNLYVTDLKSGISRYLFSNVYAGFWYN